MGKPTITKHDKERLRQDIEDGILTDFQLRDKYGVSPQMISGIRRVKQGMGAHTQTKHKMNFTPNNQVEETPQAPDEELRESPTDAYSELTKPDSQFRCGACGGVFTGKKTNCPHCDDILIWND